MTFLETLKTYAPLKDPWKKKFWDALEKKGFPTKKWDAFRYASLKSLYDMPLRKEGKKEWAFPPVEGAIQFLFLAIEKFEVNIYSGRSHQPGGIQAMETWLSYYTYRQYPGLSVDTVHSFIYYKLKWPTVKPNAIVHIDDRAITFTGEWPSISDLLEFKPWNKKEYGEGE